MNRMLLIFPLSLGLASSACVRPADEYRAALPTQDTVTVAVPDDASASQGQGLASTKRGVVGERADFYAHTYGAARDINGFGKFIVTLVQTVSDFPPTKLEADRAIWGPFSDNNEPNEWRMTSIRKDTPQLHYLWKIEGRHKSEGDADWRIITGGAFEPAAGDDGRGWFGFDFDKLAELDPSEDGRGQVAYAFDKDSAKGVAVRVLFSGPDEQCQPSKAAYAFGEDLEGQGYIGFAARMNINDAEDNRPEQEDVVIFARWASSGAGRVDVIASGGDLEADRARGAQCWDESFISTFELFTIIGDVGRILATDGDRATCKLPEQDVQELPEDIANPYASEMGELE